MPPPTITTSYSISLIGRSITPSSNFRAGSFLAKSLSELSDYLVLLVFRTDILEMTFRDHVQTMRPLRIARALSFAAAAAMRSEGRRGRHGIRSSDSH
nr:hypothetical protein SHINE37_110124 [Rhizobiaceae bacterium]